VSKYEGEEPTTLPPPNNGGRARPIRHVCPGISIRTEIAMHALPAIILVAQEYKEIGPDDVAKEAYQYADAMITEGTKDGGVL